MYRKPVGLKWTCIWFFVGWVLHKLSFRKYIGGTITIIIVHHKVKRWTKKFTYWVKSFFIKKLFTRKRVFIRKFAGTKVYYKWTVWWRPFYVPYARRCWNCCKREGFFKKFFDRVHVFKIILSLYWYSKRVNHVVNGIIYVFIIDMGGFIHLLPF